MHKGDRGQPPNYNTRYKPAAKKYHGLINQGATCYLNSVLQVLFMTEDFREAVERHVCDNPGTEFIDHQLTSLFDDLQHYDAYTHNVTRKLGIDNVYEQRDAAEYFEKILGLTSEAASQIFHGESTQKAKCSTCDTGTDANEAFWNLPLTLGNFYSRDYSVEDGIKEYFRASHFRGENQMYCDKCEAKSDATITFEMKRHPEVLMLLLKRFEFDYNYMTYVKINLNVKVPRTLQIPENQTYELYAVVDHFGDVRSGHYTAIIRSQDDKGWYHFDDTRVSLNQYEPFQVDNFETSSSAYLLFYRRKKVQAADTCTQEIGETSTAGSLLPATNDIPNYQCNYSVERRQQVEGAGNEPPVACSTQINEEGIKDTVCVWKTQLLVGEKMKSDEEMKAQGGKLLTNIDLSNDGLQCNWAGKSKENRPKDQENKPRVEEREVKGDQQQGRQVDEQAQRRGASERREQDQSGSSEWGTAQKDVGAAMRAKGGNEHVEGAESFLKKAGLAGSSSVMENRGDGCVEKSQPSEARTGLSSIKSSVEYDVENAGIKSDLNTDATTTLPKDSQKRKDKRKKKNNEIEKKNHSNTKNDAHKHAVVKKHAVKRRAERRLLRSHSSDFRFLFYTMLFIFCIYFLFFVKLYKCHLNQLIQ